MAVEVDGSGEMFGPGRPIPLFQTGIDNPEAGGSVWGLTPDARQLFLSLGSADDDMAGIHVVLNWFEELKARVPTN